MCAYRPGETFSRCDFLLVIYSSITYSFDHCCRRQRRGCVSTGQNDSADVITYLSRKSRQTPNIRDTFQTACASITEICDVFHCIKHGHSAYDRDTCATATSRRAGTTGTLKNKGTSFWNFAPNSVLFFSRPRSEGWPHHGRTFSIYPCPLSF